MCAMRRLTCLDARRGSQQMAQVLCKKHNAVDGYVSLEDLLASSLGLESIQLIVLAVHQLCQRLTALLRLTGQTRQFGRRV
ncbi:MAG: hypothetical protein WStaPseu_19220 [Shewanella algae]|uniref:Uncharacterized protein n=1 Tax=Shewanella algae TaxID=38313 RepID=A0A379YUJ7_9GAMM|nr:Uncharacterised protein [Shewanella algae]